MKIRKAVIPAAGLGTRFLPATKAMPKEMMPIVDKPIMQYMIEEAAASGIEQVIIVTSRGKESMVNHFDAMPELEDTLEKKGKKKMLEEVQRLRTLCEIVTVRQHRPLGLGHAIGCAKGAVGDEPFVALLPDDMIDNEKYPACRQLMDVYDKYGKSVVALLVTPEYQLSWYGMVKYEKVTDKIVNILDAVEKPKPEEAPSNLGIVSRYLFTPDIFEAIEQTPPGIGGEIQITDAIKRRAREGRMMGLVFEGERFDAGDKYGFLEATVHYALKHPELGPRFREMVREKLKKG
mgnify:CR=1 FL=1